MGLFSGIIQVCAEKTPPNFLLIGAAKSGTTALFDILSQHPQVYHPFTKELKFFNNDANYAKGTDWYINSYFKKAAKYPARGEASPHYLYWGDKVTSRIRETYGSSTIKFIAIFRDPVKRAYSQYWQDVQREIESLSFAEALAAEKQRLAKFRVELESTGVLKYAYHGCGCYATQLKPYLQRFPRESFHFLLQDDLKRDFAPTMQRLAEFLDIRQDFLFSPMVSNSAFKPRNRSLHRFLLSPDGPLYHFLRNIIHLFPESYRYRLRTRVFQANLQPASYPPMDLQVEHQLRTIYKDEIIRLEEIIGRDLHDWYSE